MPRSLRSCYELIAETLKELNGLYGKDTESYTFAEKIRSSLANNDITKVFQNGLHEFLLEFSHKNGELSNQVSSDYHFTV